MGGGLQGPNWSLSREGRVPRGWLPGTGCQSPALGDRSICRAGSADNGRLFTHKGLIRDINTCRITGARVFTLREMRHSMGTGRAIQAGHCGAGLEVEVRDGLILDNMCR